MDKMITRVKYIANQFERFPSEVYIGYSGGKNSSAVVKMIYNAALTVKAKDCRVKVVYCDTEVENPIVDRFAKKTLDGLEKEARSEGLNIGCIVIRPSLDHSFFVRLIGRGYPPPTNSYSNWLEAR